MRLLRLLILSCLLTASLLANGSDKIELKPEDRAALLALESQYREAVAQEEAARARKENAQLKYSLAITQFKSSYKIGDDYKFDDQAKSFVKQGKQDKSEPTADSKKDN